MELSVYSSLIFTLYQIMFCTKYFDQEKTRKRNESWDRKETVSHEQHFTGNLLSVKHTCVSYTCTLHTGTLTLFHQQTAQIHL